MEKKIGELLSSIGCTLSLAESCTAGGISSKICEFPGSSHYFMGGIICYSVNSKIRDLNVSSEEIKNNSDVSEEVAKQMADGVRERFNTDFSISTTGYTGPTGNKIGKVFIGFSSCEKTLVKEYMFEGNRQEICNQIIHQSLQILYQEIKLSN